ncbi:MAG TPA: methyltransferase domain-containing protein, partial [Oligoflexia bacterium]|nr:methyltransferase domain-containing protein [Oligoflexia bacterium]
MDEAAHTQKLDGIEEGLGREETIYRARFSEVQEEIRAQVWCVLVRDFFSRFLKGADTVVDVGAGDGNFIRNVTARRRVAVDLSPHVHDLEQSGVEVMQIPASEFAGALGGTADIVFMSNFLEHLPSKRAVLDVFDESRRALKPGGLLLILQPNIRYVG